MSTVKVLELATAQGKGVYDIDEENLEDQLALMDLPYWAQNKIRIMRREGIVPRRRGAW